MVKESVEKVRLCWRKLLIYFYKSLKATQSEFWETRAKHSNNSRKRKVVSYEYIFEILPTEARIYSMYYMRKKFREELLNYSEILIFYMKNIFLT